MPRPPTHAIFGLESAFQGISTFLNNLDWQFQLLDGSEDYGRPSIGRLLPKYFGPILQEKGVSFYIYPRVFPPDGPSIPHPEDKYAACVQACYLGGRTCNGLPYEDPKPPPGQVQIYMMRPGTAFNVMVHELAHAWHDNVVPGGSDNQCIIDAYNFSVDRDQFYNNYLFRSEPVGFLDEVREREVVSAYTATNHVEYFAELTTFYFLYDAFSRRFQLPYSNRVEMHDLD